MRGDEVACPWLTPREAGPGLDTDPLSLLVVFVFSSTFLAEECGKLKSSRAGNSDQQLTGQPAVPTGEPSLHAKPQKALAVRLCYLRTFWKLSQWSGNMARQDGGLFGAFSFVFPEEADPQKELLKDLLSCIGTYFLSSTLGTTSRG